jgi:hypothetical protein
VVVPTRHVGSVAAAPAVVSLALAVLGVPPAWRAGLVVPATVGRLAVRTGRGPHAALAEAALRNGEPVLGSGRRTLGLR